MPLALVGGREVKKSPDIDNVIPFEKAKSQNQERSEQAQKRIQSIVKALESDTGLKEGVTERGKQISAEHKRQFNKTLSQDTLYKHKHLWHPQRYIPDPWVENSIKAANNTPEKSINLGNSSQPENSANPYSEEYYGQFYQKSQVSKKQTTRNPYPEDYYGQFTYMKVLCLPPAATAPQGLEAAEVIEQREVCQKDSGVTQAVKNRELINSADSAEIDLNQPSNQLEKSVSPKKILQSNQLDFNQDLLYPSDCGDSPKSDNQNLSIVGDNGLAVVSTSTALTPEPPEEILNQGGQSASVGDSTLAPVTPELSPQSDNNGLQGSSVGDSTSDDSSRIEELKRVTKLRLMAISHARRKVRQYGVIVGRIISGQERERLEMIAKMQFYLDSGEKSLFEEATAWTDANPGWFRPFAEDGLFRQRLD